MGSVIGSVFQHKENDDHLKSTSSRGGSKVSFETRPLATKMEKFRSVKVEVEPDLNIMLESQSESDDEGPSTLPDKFPSPDQNKQGLKQGSENQLDTKVDAGPYEFVSLSKKFSDKKSSMDHKMDAVCSCKPNNLDCRSCKTKFGIDAELKPRAEEKQVNLQLKTGQFKCGGHDGKPCQRIYVLKSSLRKHMRKYTRVRSKKCEFCGKEFEFVSTLTRHVTLVHSKVGDHKCHLCAKEFLHKTSLDRHMLTHGEVRIYKCEICAKDFSYKDALSSHVGTHSDAREHKCHVCGKDFLKRGNMKRHVLTHTKPLDKICGVCGEGFSNKSALNSHVLRHSKARGQE